MRSLYFLSPGRLEWREVPSPALERPDDAIVRPIAVAMCDGDIALLRGRAPIPGPFPFGHEFVAEIVECGDEVSGFERGQAVIVPVQISCGSCDRCRRGLTAFCRTVRPSGASWGLGAFGGNCPGALADLVRIPFAGHLMVAVPNGISPRAVASAGDNVADAWRTVAPHLRENPDSEVLIIGSGSIGLYAVEIAGALGASRVDYVDTDRDRLTLAERLGARPVEGPPRERMGRYPITVDASGDPAGLTCALQAVEPGGVCTSVGIFTPEAMAGGVPLPLVKMWSSGVRFHIGRANCRAHLPEVLDLVQTSRIRPEQITSEVIDWEDAAAALTEPSLKPLVIRGGASAP